MRFRIAIAALWTGFSAPACDRGNATMDASVLDGPTDVDAPGDGPDSSDGAPMDALDVHAHDAADVGSDALDAADVPMIPVPPTLEGTGLYRDWSSRTLVDGLETWRPRYELWNDGAAKTRYLLLPPGTRIDTRQRDNWSFPVGTRIWMESRVGSTLVETRYLYHWGPERSDWLRVGYAWSADGSNATAAPLGADDVRGTGYRVVAREACDRCHEGLESGVIGISNVLLTSETGRSTLADWGARGLLSDPPTTEPTLPGTGAVRDALGYLHTNCGNCHTGEPGSEFTTRITLRLFSDDTTPEGTATYLTAINAMAFHDVAGTTVDIVPGMPDRSQLVVRMAARDATAMPPTGSLRSDTTALTFIRAWISGLR